MLNRALFNISAKCYLFSILIWQEWTKSQTKVVIHGYLVPTQVRISTDPGSLKEDVVYSVKTLIQNLVGSTRENHFYSPLAIPSLDN